MFACQVLGAAAEFEAALIRERTNEGLKAARARGRVGGNPALKARSPEAIRKVAQARERAFFDQLNRSAEAWLPTVRQMRPDHAWEDVVRVLNGKPCSTEDDIVLPLWTVDRLKRATKRFVAEGLAEARLLDRAPTRAGEDRLVTLVAGMKRAHPGITVRGLAAQLEGMRERTPRGGQRWSPSSVQHLLVRAEQLGLIDPHCRVVVGEGRRQGERDRPHPPHNGSPRA